MSSGMGPAGLGSEPGSATFTSCMPAHDCCEKEGVAALTVTSKLKWQPLNASPHGLQAVCRRKGCLPSHVSDVICI